jgi:hypothetical protein
MRKKTDAVGNNEIPNLRSGTLIVSLSYVEVPDATVRLMRALDLISEPHISEKNVLEDRTATGDIKETIGTENEAT